MPINNLNNDQNINRVYTKMSEDFTVHNNNAKLSSAVQNLNYFNNINCGVSGDDLNLPYDHMYASNTENGEVNNAEENSSCQSAESEVKFLKEWLMLHLDLIQQQNDEILNKEKTILILQQENEMLKERINCMERGTPFQSSKYFKTSPKYERDNSPEGDMTQNSSPCDEDNKSNIRLLDLNCENGNNCSLTLSDYNIKNSLCDNQNENIDVNESTSNQNNLQDEIKTEVNLENGINISVTDTISENNSICSNLNSTDYTINNLSETDPLKTLRMNIRRKRLCSTSSVLSNNDSVTEADSNKRIRKLRKKRKRYLKDDQILMTTDPYVSHTSDMNSNCGRELSVETATASTNLEVPRWRVKVYASCYTMEGTENLDDEVYNKRHSRLENDERRRKRWDVQRIREQRVIEKLKQRQERIGSGSKNDDQNQIVNSFWPAAEDIRFMDVSDQLPVSVFGYPIARLTPSEFSLPWLNNSNMSVKKIPTRKTTTRRRTSKR